MIEIIRDAERRSLNVISLAHLLGKADPKFRALVVGALVQEGFELNEPLPCLQHPQELLDTLEGLEAQGPGGSLDQLRSALLAAARTGILVDLSGGAKRSRFPNRSFGLPLPTGHFHPSLETS